MGAHPSPRMCSGGGKSVLGVGGKGESGGSLRKDSQSVKQCE